MQGVADMARGICKGVLHDTRVEQQRRTRWLAGFQGDPSSFDKLSDCPFAEEVGVEFVRLAQVMAIRLEEAIELRDAAVKDRVDGFRILQDEDIENGGVEVAHKVSVGVDRMWVILQHLFIGRHLRG
jgi:hypothetical protein